MDPDKGHGVDAEVANLRFRRLRLRKLFRYEGLQSMTYVTPDTRTPARDLHDVDTSPRTDSTSVESPGRPPQAGRKGTVEQIALFGFIAIPFLALLTAVPFAWGWGLGWHDVVIAVVAYAVAGHGVTVGFHRYFTHGSFKAGRWLRIALAVSGSLAIEGPVIRWVADHRRHHAFSDREGDPHSPWRYGETVPALIKGLWWAHTGWLFDVELTPRDKYAPDLMADKDLRRVEAAFPALVAVSVLAPALIGGLWSMSWQGAATAFFWGHSSASACSTTSRGRSTRSATPSAIGPSRATTSRPTSGGWRSCRWVSPGTTCTTPTRPAHATASTRARSTPAPASSGHSRRLAGPMTSGGRGRNASASGESPFDRAVPRGSEICQPRGGEHLRALPTTDDALREHPGPASRCGRCANPAGP